MFERGKLGIGLRTKVISSTLYDQFVFRKNSNKIHPIILQILETGSMVAETHFRENSQSCGRRKKKKNCKSYLCSERKCTEPSSVVQLFPHYTTAVSNVAHDNRTWKIVFSSDACDREVRTWMDWLNHEASIASRFIQWLRVCPMYWRKRTAFIARLQSMSLPAISYRRNNPRIYFIHFYRIY